MAGFARDHPPRDVGTNRKCDGLTCQASFFPTMLADRRPLLWLGASQWVGRNRTLVNSAMPDSRHTDPKFIWRASTLLRELTSAPKRSVPDRSRAPEPVLRWLRLQVSPARTPLGQNRTPRLPGGDSSSNRWNWPYTTMSFCIISYNHHHAGWCVSTQWSRSGHADCVNHRAMQRTVAVAPSEDQP